LLLHVLIKILPGSVRTVYEIRLKMSILPSSNIEVPKN